MDNAIRDVPNNKSAGDDEVINRALGTILDIAALWKILRNTFQAGIDRQYSPKHIRRSISVSLRKPGKDDYSIPKAYRSIALLITMGKVLESVMANRLAWAVETYKLLPDPQMGGRRVLLSEIAV